MRKLLKRWYIWSFLFMAIVIGGAIPVPVNGRIKRADFDRINDGMTEAEVRDILGEPDKTWAGDTKWVTWGRLSRSHINLRFSKSGTVECKQLNLITTREYVRCEWHDLLYKMGL